jgi:lysophospholipase L1-like esterase
MRARVLLLAVALVPALAGACEGVAVGSLPQSPDEPRCPVRTDLLPVFSPESRTVRALQNGAPLVIVAIGSSSTEGYGASSPQRTYPAQLQAMLTQRWPGSAIRVVNAGVSGDLLEQMQARFARDVYPAAPDLVILQTGTIEATRNLPLGPFLDRFRASIAGLTSRGYDVAIMDSQYYPGVGESPHYQAMQDSVASVALAQGVPLIRRYEMMRYFVESGRYTLPELLFQDNFHPSDLTYECTAQSIVNGLEISESTL